MTEGATGTRRPQTGTARQRSRAESAERATRAAEQAADMGRRPPVSVLGAAELLGVSRWTVYRMIEEGKLRAVRVGPDEFSPLKVRRIDIDEYLERKARAIDRFVS